MNQIEIKQGWILYQKDFQESTLLWLWSKEFGKISIWQKSKKKKLQYFSPWEITINVYKEKKYLAKAINIEPAINLSGQAFWSAFYINELLLKLLPDNEADQKLYAQYIITLNELALNYNIANCLRKFEKVLIAQLGYNFSWWVDYTGNPILPNTKYKFVPQQGIVKTAYEDNNGFLGSVFLSIAKDENNSNEMLKEKKELMRVIIDDLLDGKTLNSKLIFQS